MSDALCEINLSDIDLTDERYKISFSENDPTFLALSIREAGLMCPPLVKPVNHKFIIISGFNRVRAMLSNHQRKIVVYQTKPDASEYQCLLKAITSIAFKRPLTHAELILSARRLSPFLDAEQISKKSPAILNTELTVRFIEELFTIGSLPDPTLELIHLGHLSLNTARRLALFEKRMMEMLLNIFSNIKASNSKQLEIIQNIMEITARDAIDPIDFFETKEMQALLWDENNGPGVKTTLLRAYLFERRFPTVFKTHQRVQEKIAAIKLGSSIKFVPPENFESRYYTISFKAEHYDEFAANVQTLHTALENKALKDVFNP